MRHAELADHASFFTGQQLVQSAGESAQLVRVLQNAGFVLELGVLAGREFGLFDLFGDVSQVVRSPFRLGAARGERRDLTTHLGDLLVRAPNELRLPLSAAKSIQDSALRFAIEERLRVVLAMEIHQLSSNLGEDAGRHRRSIDPGATAAIRRDLALQNQRIFFDLDPPFVGERRDVLELADVEDAFHCRLVRARANEIGTRALAEEKSQRTDDDRLAGPGFSGKNVESRREWKRDLLDDRKIADA